MSERASARRSLRGVFRSGPPQQNLTCNEILAYRFQQIITGSTATKLGFVLSLCMPYVLASATFYRSLSSESWFQAIYKTVRSLPRDVQRAGSMRSPCCKQRVQGACRDVLCSVIPLQDQLA